MSQVIALGISGVAVLGVLGAVLLLVLWLISMNNKLVKLRERARNAFSQIDVQLERRYDLIPNLIEVARKYMSHESETFQAITEARTVAGAARKEVNGDPSNGPAMAELGKSESALGGLMRGLMINVENYPELKADRTMTQLSEELTTTENKIAFARQGYNDAVAQYQIYRNSFPPVLLASLLGFSSINYLELDETPEKRDPVKVNFDA